MVELAAGTPTTIHCEVCAELGGSAATGAANGKIRIAHPSRILANVFTSTTVMVTGANRRTGEAQPKLSKL